MIAYKGFTKDITAIMGNGTYQFQPGETVKTETSKTMRTGFHCCENPFECLAYYPLGGANRYFQVEISGSIDEDEGERIACTEMTLLKELSLKEFAGYGMMYMVQHPLRTGWKQKRKCIEVTDEVVDNAQAGEIVIVRGHKPMVKGAAGSILGLILEPTPGQILAAKVFESGRDAKADTLYTLDADRKLREVPNEEKEN